MSRRLPPTFFLRNVLDVAPELLGKTLVRNFAGSRTERFTITDVEAYKGGEDKACHASKGKTARTEIMFGRGGKVYVYLIYGIYWMLNVVTGEENDASAVLIRGVKGISGPGRVGRALRLDKSFYGEDLSFSKKIWIEDAPEVTDYSTAARVGIDYAGEPWTSIPWRFILSE